MWRHSVRRGKLFKSAWREKEGGGEKVKGLFHARSIFTWADGGGGGRRRYGSHHGWGRGEGRKRKLDYAISRMGGRPETSGERREKSGDGREENNAINEKRGGDGGRKEEDGLAKKKERGKGNGMKGGRGRKGSISSRALEKMFYFRIFLHWPKKEKRGTAVQ